MNNEQQFLDFVSKIAVMKPAVINEDNKNHVQKMNDILFDPSFVAEEKIDGCHYMLFGFRFFSTEGVEKTNNYPHLKKFFYQLGFGNLILDGEINYPGKTSQFCTRVTGSGSDAAIMFQQDYAPIHYTVWDMLRTPKGTWLINQPYKQRRKMLEYFYDNYIKDTPMEEFVHLTETCYDNKKQYYEKIIADGREGVVLKRIDGLYVMGKKPMWQWMKLKQKDTADLFISGYEEPNIKYTGKSFTDWPYWNTVDGELIPVTKYFYLGWIGSLILSAYVDGKVTPICSCSGIDEALRQSISEHREAYLNKVVKISFMEKTEKGFPRHPRFEGFHESKTSDECKWTF